MSSLLPFVVVAAIVRYRLHGIVWVKEILRISNKLLLAVVSYLFLPTVQQEIALMCVIPQNAPKLQHELEQRQPIPEDQSEARAYLERSESQFRNAARMSSWDRTLGKKRQVMMAIAA